MKVIIAGVRNLDAKHYQLISGLCDRILHDVTVTEIVGGGASGVDKMGERYAKELGHPFKEFPADWKTHGKAAGPIRNKQMAEYADMLIAFWDGRSRGTKNMIDQANKHRLKVVVWPI